VLPAGSHLDVTRVGRESIRLGTPAGRLTAKWIGEGWLRNVSRAGGARTQARCHRGPADVAWSSSGSDRGRSRLGSIEDLHERFSADLRIPATRWTSSFPSSGSCGAPTSADLCRSSSANERHMDRRLLSLLECPARDAQPAGLPRLRAARRPRAAALKTCSQSLRARAPVKALDPLCTSDKSTSALTPFAEIPAQPLDPAVVVDIR
jgi:hypothetical protein